MNRLLQQLLTTFTAGGWLMLPLTLITFTLWLLFAMACTETQASKLSASIKIMAALVTTAPLIGLLGTVLGMIQTFDAVAAQDGTTATLVADGIAKALITTQAGLITAIPGTFLIAYLNSKLKKLNRP